MDVAIVVRGGMVQAVYSKRDDLDVEVFDLDVPVYVTAEEQFDFEQKENQVKEIVESPEWRCAW